jgi:hypothetical protein
MKNKELLDELKELHALLEEIKKQQPIIIYQYPQYFQVPVLPPVTPVYPSYPISPYGPIVWC